MEINYAEILERKHRGESLKDILAELNIPVRYDTFQKAIRKYETTGHKGIFKFNENSTKKEMTKDEILEKISSNKGLKKDTLKDAVIDKIYSLVKEGYNIELNDGVYTLIKNIKVKENVVRQEWNGCSHFRIGVISDTHIGNVNTQMSFLKDLYKKFKKYGVKDVYHCGDISDGWYPNRSDQVYELYAHGADAQVNYIVEHYPKEEGITTHFITGNHDYTFVRNTGYNIGPSIEMRRPDMHYLGHNNARVWLTPNCDIELNHPADGAAYAMSYSIQKYIDSMTGGQKPKILLNGHHHKYLSMFYRNIHAIEVPCIQAQTFFMKGKRLAAHMGGLILDIDVNEDGTIERFCVELIPLYETKTNDY